MLVIESRFKKFQADIVCYQLGYNSGAVSAKTNSFFGQVPDDFSYNAVACSGAENSLDECSHYNHENCGPTEGAGVICNTTKTPGNFKTLTILLLLVIIVIIVNEIK